MRDDDGMVGRILTRRELVRLFGAGGTLAMVGGLAGAWPVGAAGAQGATAMPGCVVRPEQTEGPYFVDRQIVRSTSR